VGVRRSGGLENETGLKSPAFDVRCVVHSNTIIAKHRDKPMSTASTPSQKILVQRLLNWELVEKRLAKYPAIADNFRQEIMSPDHRENGPYFCHYMAWRLGTWETESLFSRINDLLACAQTLPNWDHEREKLGNRDFGQFWSVVWALQVAEYLGSQGTNVSWNKSGPDLSVMISGQRLYVECYTYHKSFDAELYMEEILQTLGDDLRVRRDMNLPFSLPQGDALTNEISRLLQPFQDETSLSQARERALTKYPDVLSRSDDTRLKLYVDGENVSAYSPTAMPTNDNNPDDSLERALREAVKSKKDSNSLGVHRPNILMVNCLLSTEVQLAEPEPDTLPRNLLNDAPDLEAIAFATLGIDAQLKKSDLRLAASKSGEHLCHALVSAA
jgi:hypothetical protein